MSYYHRRNDVNRTFTEKYIKNFKFLSKVCITTVLLIDLIVFYTTLPEVIFRVSRLIRPCKKKIVVLELKSHWFIKLGIKTKCSSTAFIKDKYVIEKEYYNSKSNRYTKLLFFSQSLKSPFS